MNRYYTIMIVPEKGKEVQSFKIPYFIYRGLIGAAAVLFMIIGILLYDYWNVLGQVYENKHLLIENRQLREQVQLFQMKMNTIGEDLERLSTFERKLRNISGLEPIPVTPQGELQLEDKTSSWQLNQVQEPDRDFSSSTVIRLFKHAPKKYVERLQSFEGDKNFEKNRKKYEDEISALLNTEEEVRYAQEWKLLGQQSLALASQYAAFDYKYDLIKEFVHDVELRINQVDQFLLDKESFIKSTPTIMPAAGHFTSEYGPRMSPYAGRIKMHEGIDIGASVGTAIVAPADGVVTFSGPKTGFGNFIQIDHGYGVQTIFGHMAQLFVRKGQRVDRGTRIASVGNTGYSTGPHLHYEVRINGTPVDPIYYILN